ncbi:MAG TPA: IS1634 family transposase [Deltaproteobacteria bacterium]|jgi:transposase|nr:IS1634 family transposase [Deltaproteobacteria bacterium]HPA70236.1 IS1634 family transposase [Bacteroidales bacterium]HPR53274.1 IS1634 family transposase [Deltaproteobacteria bacterium]
MFFREKKTKGYSYLQVVENQWVDGRSRQRVLGTLGRLDQLREAGHLDALLASGARYSQSLMVLSAHKEGRMAEISKKKIGGPLIFERLWKESGCAEIIGRHARGRKFGFDLERAVFTTVLHRLMSPGSDRACEKWKEAYRVEGADALDLQHFYRAMGWLGNPLGEEEQDGLVPFSPRCVKDVIEEELFFRRRDLFTTMDMMFFDTTSIYFEGEGGDTLGEYGHSKDHRPDLKQMVVGALLDGEGHPVCCEMWPGNTTDVNTLIPVVGRMKKRFGVERACVVADRGMISKETLSWMENPQNPTPYILGARMRRVKEIDIEVLGRAGRYQVVHPQRSHAKDPSPLKVKEVLVEGRRHIVCHNDDQAAKDASDREAILKSLTDKLKGGDKSLVGNKGYRRYLKTRGESFVIDEKKVADDARYDGKWVLRTNTDLPAAEVALKYKQLWMVETLFRTIKSVLATRPIYHKRDETIRGHVFCSFLALILMKELMGRLEDKSHSLEWKDIIRDLDNMDEVELEEDGKRFVIRTGSSGCCGKVFQAAGVTIPPTIRQVQ